MLGNFAAELLRTLLNMLLQRIMSLLQFAILLLDLLEHEVKFIDQVANLIVRPA